MARNRIITNFVEFKEDMGERWEFAYQQFQLTEPEENGAIISSYDSEGYCIFEHIGDRKYEFTGTVK